MSKKINEIKVDIILPNYNSDQFFSETIDSVLGQTFKNWQLIVVDDNSNLNDNSNLDDNSYLDVNSNLDDNSKLDDNFNLS